ncbi:MAG: MMPL family transporter [Myxococcales bacterium]|nr:MMPL family transporter [Myxococcales bacterium]
MHPTESVGPTAPPIVEASLRRPRAVLWLAALLALLAALFSTSVRIDTDPQNMLPVDHEVRVRNAEMRQRFATHEMIVVGIVDLDGVATPRTLTAVDALRRDIEGLDGVVADEVLSFASAVGTEPDLSDAATVDALVRTVDEHPLLSGHVLSEDGSTAALFVPLRDKSHAAAVAAQVEGAIGDSPVLSQHQTYVTGLPLAEQAFGSQMFVQMAVFAPLAGLLIMAIMWWFFRRISLVATAMAVAGLSVIWTMGALIGTGHTLHIMSSMIPIFLMPIAILDSVHVLSEFHDRYGATTDRQQVLREVYTGLIRPLTYTSLTTAVGFAALALAPIPPIQVFGVFVALGVLAAYLLTLTLVPALVILLPETWLASPALAHHDRSLAEGLRWLGRMAAAQRVNIMAGFTGLALLSAAAIGQIEVDDNPVNWFLADSEVRVASEELNRRLPGTFGANLLLRAEDPDALHTPQMVRQIRRLQDRWGRTQVVGSSTSYADLVEGGSTEEIRAQLTAAAEQSPLVKQLITDSGQHANLRLQLSSGNNQAMASLVGTTDDFFDDNPLPDGVTAQWAGETYLNLVWQDEMVSGMLRAFATTLGVVLLLMGLLFRSVPWALTSVTPVLWTVGVVYGALGLGGKPYDMPIAVLSTLVLGIGVDFAIHFVERFRHLLAELGDPAAALRAFFEEPARALTRNALVIAVGFTPLLFASLVPYRVVGALLASIIALGWLATLVLLPAMVAGWARPPAQAPVAPTIAGQRSRQGAACSS